jgi:hypothetical protein
MLGNEYVKNKHWKWKAPMTDEGKENIRVAKLGKPSHKKGKHYGRI